MKRTFAQLTPLAAAVALALGSAPAMAQEFLEIDDLVNPQSRVTAGMGFVDDDSRWYGEYSGFIDYDEDGFQPLFDLDYVTRDSETGTWVRANADIGRRAMLGAEYEKQGDFGIGFNYQRITRQDPLNYNTGLTGRLTENQQLNGRAPRDVTFRTERDDFRLNLNKEFGNGFGGRVMFREMQRDGTRNWGIHDSGFGPGSVHEFIAEPIEQTTREVEAEIGYNADALSLAGGIYGTSFDNDNKVVRNDTANIARGHPEVSLPLSNSSMQVYLNGAYTFTPTTRMNFKFAQTKAEQDENFYQPHPNGRTNLDGEIETTLAYVGFASHPTDLLSVNASLRYEDREDNTPVDAYTNDGGTRDGNNVPFSRESTAAKVEVGYELPMGFKALGALGWDAMDRSAPPERSVSYADSEETSYRAEIRRSMSETLNGSFSYTYRDRDAENIRESEPSNDGVRIVPPNMSDRKRDEWRFVLDWMPSEPMAVQFTYQLTDDEYDRISMYGPIEGETELISLDASLMINEDWTVNGWIARDTSSIVNSTCIHPTSRQTCVQDPGYIDWTSDVEYVGDSVGLGLRGLVAFQHHVGADVTYGKDKSKYGLRNVPAGTEPIPDIEYEYTRFNLWGEYVLNEFSGIRADWVYTKFENDEWAWNDWEYADGTTVRSRTTRT
jgi:MtrB/PioB family decaheme-associated outer membrane protein